MRPFFEGSAIEAEVSQLPPSFIALLLQWQRVNTSKMKDFAEGGRRQRCGDVRGRDGAENPGGLRLLNI